MLKIPASGAQRPCPPAREGALEFPSFETDVRWMCFEFAVEMLRWSTLQAAHSEVICQQDHVTFPHFILGFCDA
jgi:hypothetical protein